jgi:murein DD-endopeptidase MepM/ murein hydrolase activator NlpD
MRRNARIWPVLLAVLLAAACGRVVYHRVQPGETLSRISKAYGVPIAQLVHANRIANPDRIEVGQELRIPGARRRVPVDTVTPRRADPGMPAGVPATQLSWPVEGGSVSSGFGQRGDSFHDGVDISAPLGTTVRAAGAGVVVYSDVLRGYGKVILLSHDGELVTVYAHNDQNLVRAGQRVRRGEKIATVGDSGRTTGPNLHFEVRHDGVARNPLFFLPTLRMAEPDRQADRDS